MSATYDPSLPSPKDHIRQLLGDTDTTTPILQDETIIAKLQAFGWGEALAQLAEGLISQYAQEPDTLEESGGMKQQWTARLSSWQALVVRARAGEIGEPNVITPTHSPIVSRVTTVQATLPGHGILHGFRSW
jgi:hypothetical protein